MKNMSSTRLLQHLLLLAVAFGAGSALAAGNSIKLGNYDVWTVYGFGNAQALKDTFRALANLANSGTLRAAFTMTAVVGVLIVGLTSGFQMGGARKLIGYFVGVLLLSYVMFGPTNDGPLTVQIDVVDTVEPGVWKAPVTVPAVIGIPAALISMTGYELTKVIEASFNINDAFKLSQGAPFNLPGALLADASQARITDPNLASSLSYYVQDCFTIAVARGALQASTLLQSTNFIQDIKFDSNTIMVNTLLTPGSEGVPDLTTCTTAWTYINDAVNTQGGSDASGYLRNASAWAKTPALSVVNAGADALAQYVGNNGLSNGGSLVKQAAVLAAFKDAHSQAAIQTGNSEFLTGIAMAQATEAQRTSWITGAEVFNKTMGYIFAILQVFVYAVTSLVLFAIVIPGLGLALLKNFAQILLWLALWQPMLAIVNFVVLTLQQGELTNLMSTGGGSYGFSMSNMGIVSEKSANFRAAATFVGTMVPALAWGLVKGALDFSRVIGSAMGENFAQGAANTMTTGNYSLNQASMDSFTSNKHSIAATGAWGHGFSTNSAAGAKSNDLAGAEMPRANGQQLGISVSDNVGTNAAGSIAHVTGTGTNANQQITGSNAAAYNNQGSSSRVAAEVNASAQGTTTGTTVALAGNKSILRPNPGDPRGNLGAGGSGDGGGGGSDKKGEEPSKMGKPKAPGSLSLNGTAQLYTGATGNRTDTNTLQQAKSAVVSGGVTQTGVDTKTAGRSTSDMTNANTTQGYSEGRTMTIQGIGSAANQADAMAAYYASRSGGVLTQGEWGRRPQAQSELGQKVQTLAQADGVRNAVAEQKQDVTATQKKQAAENKELRKEAEKAKSSYVAKALGQQDEGIAGAYSEKAEKAADLSATQRAGMAIAGAGSEAAVSLIQRMPISEEEKKELIATVNAFKENATSVDKAVSEPKPEPTPEPKVEPSKAPTIGTSNAFGSWR